MNNERFAYKWWKVVAYEITILLINNNGKWGLHPIVKMVREECVHDWTKYKTQKTMDDLDKEIESIVKYYETRRKKSRFKKYEQKHGETPLGGEMRITADFMDDD